MTTRVSCFVAKEIRPEPLLVDEKIWKVDLFEFKIDGAYKSGCDVFSSFICQLHRLKKKSEGKGLTYSERPRP